MVRGGGDGLNGGRLKGRGAVSPFRRWQADSSTLALILFERGCGGHADGGSKDAHSVKAT